ncbi:MAG: radical SAM protein [Acidaminococcaceae bacterium]|nr:radical SAM protein [Acidaminococcaceae bacterium]
MEGVALDPRVRACTGIAGMELRFRGNVTRANEGILGLCCESKPVKPEIAFQSTEHETLEKFIGLRHIIMAESIKYCDNYSLIKDERELSKCVDCASFQTNYSKGYWTLNPQFAKVHMAVYPSPCQARCCYCRAEKSWEYSSQVKDGYEKMFRTIKYADDSGLIDPNALWEIASGEIAIHPYKNRFYEVIQGKKTMFFSNCMVFDERIAQHLNETGNSGIAFSIDAGTKEHWKEVKGFDNFESTVNNFKQYCESSRNVSGFQLKYIVLPGVNDSEHDYQSLMEIMSDCGITVLMISRDSFNEYKPMESQTRDTLISAAASLVKKCKSNGFRWRFIKYTPNEKKEIERRASEEALK